MTCAGHNGSPPGGTRTSGLFKRFAGSRDGVAAIEFAILAIPFFLIVFAIIETFVAYAGEQLLENAVDTLSREIRTGQITYAMGRPTDKTKAEFQAAFCDEIAIMMTCGKKGDEQKLYLDVRSFDTFADMPIGIPRKDSDRFSDLDTTGFEYRPGGPGARNMVRAYYRWSIITDLVRPYITNVRPDGDGMSGQYLMVATTAFVNEGYP